ncbi:MAG: aminotransferase class III-fold pyridoxal phosphate-dependent enzyme, partial [Steroidobacteraceae bacterium]
AHVEGPYKFMHGRGQTDEAYGHACAEALERKIRELGADNIAAFMAEPVYGAAGIIVPPANYWPAINRICRKHDVLICADEVVCGFGRTGEWFGSHLYGIEADFLTLAKGLTSGYVPMGAAGIAEPIAEVLRTHGGLIPHGFTCSGHPVAAAAAFKNIEILRNEQLIERVREDIGPYLQEQFATLSDHPLVGEVRGVGLMAALEIVADKETLRPFPEEVHAAYVVQAKCAQRGLIMRAMRESLYCAPPFTISRSEIDFLVETTREALDATHGTLDPSRRDLRST